MPGRLIDLSPVVRGCLFIGVSRRFQRPIAWLALVAWLAASGLSWDLLQVVAWTKMSVENAGQSSVGAAVTKALADAPCAMCKVAQDGRKQSEQQPLAKEGSVKAKAKADRANSEARSRGSELHRTRDDLDVYKIMLAELMEIPR